MFPQIAEAPLRLEHQVLNDVHHLVNVLLPPGQPEGPPTGLQVQVLMNDPQGPNKTVPQDQPGPQVPVPPIMSTFPSDQDGQLLSWISLMLPLSNCSRPSPIRSSSLMEKLTTWLFSWKA